MPGERQHRIAAAHLSQFSSEITKDIRRRRLYVRRRESNIFRAAVDRLNFENSIFDYSLPQMPADLDTLDKVWGMYESSAPSALSVLCSAQPLPWTFFLQSIVPSLAGMCVRSHSFDDWCHAHGINDKDVINAQRGARLLLIAGRMLRSTWFIWKSDGSRFITNDSGAAPVEQLNGRPSVFFPLRAHTGLLLDRGNEPAVWQTSEERKSALFLRSTVPNDWVDMLNNAAIRSAKREVYGQQSVDVKNLVFGPEESALQQRILMIDYLAGPIALSPGLDPDYEYWVNEQKELSRWALEQKEDAGPSSDAE